MQHVNVKAQHHVLASLLARGRFLLVAAILLGAFGAFGTLGIGNAVVNAATLSVATTGTDSNTCGASGTPCLTIQQAVNNAASGDTVSVAAGTYIGQVAIAKNLTLTGAGQGLGGTIIKAPTAAGLTANSLGLEVLLDVSLGTVIASGFSVSGPVFTPSACGDDFYGIYDRGGAALNLTNVTVSNIRNSDNALLDCQQGDDIRYGSRFLAQAASGTIDHVTVTGYQKTGIVIDGDNTTVKLSNSTITGDGPQTNIGQNGVQISRGAHATVTGNTISGDECNAPTCGPNGNSDVQSGAILLFDAGSGTTISNNTINTSDAGVLRSDTNTSSPSVTISGNTFNGNRYEGIYLFGGPTTLTNNTINGPTTTGIELGSDTTTSPQTPTGPVTYMGNTFGSGVTTQSSAAAAPTVTSIAPNTAANTASTAVTITGMNFTPGATVTVGGQACTSVVVATSAQITCTVPPRPITGAQAVVVTNPDTQSGTLPNGFTFTTGDTTQNTVAYAFTGLDGQTAKTPTNFSVNVKLTNNVTVDPNNTLLRYKATLMRNGAPVTGLSITYNGGTAPTGGTFMTDSMGNAFFGPATGFTLTQVPALTSMAGVTTTFASTLPTGGNYTLSVQLLDITNTGSPLNIGAPGSKAFAVVFVPPTITALSSTGVVVTGTQEVAITGTAFQPGARVKVDGQFVQTTVVTGDTTLSFTPPPHAVGSVTVTVVNPDGKSSNGLPLTYDTITTQPNMVSTPAAASAGASLVTQLATHVAGAAAVGATPISQPTGH